MLIIRCSSTSSLFLPFSIFFLTACTAHSSCERPQKEEELRAALEDALHEAKEQHQKEVAELEQRLQASHQAEWDKVQQAYQEEAARCTSLQQQVGTVLKTSNQITLT